MLEHKNALATAGIACSIGSYYCLAKVIDPNNECPRRNAKNEQQKVAYIFTAAVLKAASLTLLTPKLAQSSHSTLRLCLEEGGALFIGMGLYNLETAFAKYRKHQREEPHLFHENNAIGECALGALFIALGSSMLPAIFIEEETCL